jgi:hypothetical protein
MSLLLDSRHGSRSGLLPWTLLIIGSTASLAANVAVAEPSAVGRLIAGWPSCALIGSYELLMRQIRYTSMRNTKIRGIASYVPHVTSEEAHTGSGSPRTSPGALAAPSAEPLTSHVVAPEGPEKSHADGVVDLIGAWDRPRPADANRPRGRRSLPRRGGRGDWGIRRQAWQWAVANRTSDGDLPPGKAIASEFGRSERWGRLVKQAGLAGRLEETVV